MDAGGVPLMDGGATTGLEEVLPLVVVTGFAVDPLPSVLQPLSPRTSAANTTAAISKRRSRFMATCPISCVSHAGYSGGENKITARAITNDHAICGNPAICHLQTGSFASHASRRVSLSLIDS